MGVATPRPGYRTAMLLLIACLAGALLAPVTVYLFGSTVMGPYEGAGGLGGFTASVFSAAADGKPGALALLLTPAGLALTWYLVARLLRLRGDEPEGDADNPRKVSESQDFS